MPHDRSRVPVLAVLVTVVLWASAFVGVRAAGHDFGPGALALGRMLAGSATLTVIVAVRALRGTPVRLPDRRALPGVLAWGVGWFGLYNLLLNTAERHIDAGTTALLVNFAPVLVAVLAGLLLGEGFPRRLLIGMGVALVGVATIAATAWTGRGDLLGVLLGLGAAVLYAAGATGQKRLLQRTDLLSMTWIGALAGTALCLPFAGDLSSDLATAPTGAALSVVYLGVFPTGIAFLTWGYALSSMSAGRLASTTYLVPPLVVLLSWAATGETPAWPALVGGAVSLLGVAIATGRIRLRGSAPAPASASRTAQPSRRR